VGPVALTALVVVMGETSEEQEEAEARTTIIVRATTIGHRRIPEDMVLTTTRARTTGTRMVHSPRGGKAPMDQRQEAVSALVFQEEDPRRAVARAKAAVEEAVASGRTETMTTTRTGLL